MYKIKGHTIAYMYVRVWVQNSRIDQCKLALQIPYISLYLMKKQIYIIKGMYEKKEKNNNQNIFSNTSKTWVQWNALFFKEKKN